MKLICCSFYEIHISCTMLGQRCWGTCKTNNNIETRSERNAGFPWWHCRYEVQLFGGSKWSKELHFCCLIYIPQIIWIQSADAVGKQMETGENYLCDDIKGHWNATPNSVIKF